MPRLHETTSRFNTHFHYTITAYGPDIEPRMPDLQQSVETLIILGVSSPSAVRNISKNRSASYVLSAVGIVGRGIIRTDGRKVGKHLPIDWPSIVAGFERNLPCKPAMPVDGDAVEGCLEPSELVSGKLHLSSA